MAETDAVGSGAPGVAVIGLGAMGLPMAQRLASRLRITAFDTDPGRLEQARAAGAEVAVSPAAAAAGAGCVLLALRTFEQAQQALFGPGGAATTLAPGTVVALTSTVGADAARSLADRVGATGAVLVDAPVSGGPARAADGELLVFVSGAEAALTAFRPVLELLASGTVTVGATAGDAQLLKAVNQLLCGVHIAAAAEALALADGLGLDPQAALQSLGLGAAASFMLGHRGPRIVQALAGIEPEVSSRLDIFVKDMGIVLEAARGAGVATPIAAAAEQLYRIADGAGLSAADDATVVRMLRTHRARPEQHATGSEDPDGNDR